MTPEKNAFLEPQNATHRQYEALRAFFVDDVDQAEAARRFGYSLNTFRVMCSLFRRNTTRHFFVEPRRGPRGKVAKDECLRERIVALRKQNLSVYDIADHLQSDGRSLTAAAIAAILKKEGFSRLPRRRDEERATHSGPEKAL